MSDVRTWLAGIGLGRYADAFEANDVEMDQLYSRLDFVVKVRLAPLAVVQPVVGRARKPSFIQWRTIPCRLDVNGDKGWTPAVAAARPLPPGWLASGRSDPVELSRLPARGLATMPR